MNPRLPRFLAPLVLAAGLSVGAAPAAAAPDHLASLVLDVDAGRVVHAYNANRPLFPASLTKLMTIYLILEALEAGDIALDTQWKVSAGAAGQAPVRLGLDAGEKLTVKAVLDALSVLSANDAAVVAAEGLDGSEPAFARRMTAKARALGMASTTYRNASGLPNPGQITTARDTAVLALALARRFTAHAGLFKQRSFTHRGRTHRTRNGFLSAFSGATGMKTGFTCKAGFNLVGTARRDGRAFIGVLLGAPSRERRVSGMANLMRRAFDGKSKDPLTLVSLAAAGEQGASLSPPAKTIADSCIGGGGPRGWSIDVAVERTAGAARRKARQFIAKRRSKLGGARTLVVPRFTGVDLYRGCVTGLSEDRAREVCLEFRRQGGHCIIFGPDTARHLLNEAKRVRKLRKRAKAG